jgi:hypothetical protein
MLLNIRTIVMLIVKYYYLEVVARIVILSITIITLLVKEIKI